MAGRSPPRRTCDSKRAATVCSITESGSRSKGPGGTGTGWPAPLIRTLLAPDLTELREQLRDSGGLGLLDEALDDRLRHARDSGSVEQRLD